jgi:hypothetical protein
MTLVGNFVVYACMTGLFFLSLEKLHHQGLLNVPEDLLKKENRDYYEDVILLPDLPIIFTSAPELATISNTDFVLFHDREIAVYSLERQKKINYHLRRLNVPVGV